MKYVAAVVIGLLLGLASLAIWPVVPMGEQKQKAVERPSEPPVTPIANPACCECIVSALRPENAEQMPVTTVYPDCPCCKGSSSSSSSSSSGVNGCCDGMAVPNTLTATISVDAPTITNCCSGLGTSQTVSLTYQTGIVFGPLNIGMSDTATANGWQSDPFTLCGNTYRIILVCNSGQVSPNPVPSPGSGWQTFLQFTCTGTGFSAQATSPYGFSNSQETIVTTQCSPFLMVFQHGLSNACCKSNPGKGNSYTITVTQ